VGGRRELSAPAAPNIAEAISNSFQSCDKASILKWVEDPTEGKKTDHDEFSDQDFWEQKRA
jgi:hypothetical protein